MKNYEDIPEEIRNQILQAKSLAIWPLDENPMTDSYQTARFFQDNGWYIYPVHESADRLLDVNCVRDIRLIPDDYDILYVFSDIDRLPMIVNGIFNADYEPPLVWFPEGIIDLETIDRLTEGGIKNVMDTDLMEFYKFWTD